MFSKSNFIIPVQFGNVLKIRNTQNAIVHIIKEAECTVKHIDLILYIKQNAESAVIALNFATTAEAREAHTLLRNALDQLRGNLSINSGGFYTHIFNPILTTINIDTEMPINLLIREILALYVNGVLINSVNYTLLLAPPRLLWKGTAPYILEPDDEVTIHYN